MAERGSYREIVEERDPTYIVPPECGGQMVEIAYATVQELGIVRRLHDRSTGRVEYALHAWPDGRDPVCEPWNAEPQLGELIAEW